MLHFGSRFEISGPILLPGRSFVISPLRRLWSRSPFPKEGSHRAPRDFTLIVQRNGSTLTHTQIQLWDALNGALGFAAIRSTATDRQNLILTGPKQPALPTVPKPSQHLHHIPRTLSLRLDTVSAAVIMHGNPTTTWPSSTKSWSPTTIYS